MLRKAWNVLLVTGAVLSALVASIQLVDWYVTDDINAQVDAAFYGVLYLIMQEGLRHA